MGSDNSDNLIESEEKRARSLSLLARSEWILAILLTVVVLFLLIARMTHAGALDRDECDALHLARMPRWTDVIENLHHTAFPILFPATVRAYTGLFGTSDVSVRYFGLAVGILMLSVAWFHSRSVNRQLPLLLPALIGLNVNFLTTGGWLRGYGLGSLLAVLAVVFTEKLLLQPTARRFFALFVVCVAATQVLVFNAVLVAAIVLAGMAVLFLNHNRRWMWLLAAAALVSALLYIPYVIVFLSKVSQWVMLAQFPLPVSAMLRQGFEACAGSPFTSAFWLGLVLLAWFGGVWRLRVVWNAGATAERSMLIFGVVAIAACALAYFVFLCVAHNRLQERHFLPLICAIAVATDLIVANLVQNHWIRLGRVILVVAAIATLPIISWPKIVERQTNMDTLAARLEREVAPNDLIVVSPWWLGISFGHYFHGTNRWMTVPEISDHRIHRYDLLKVKMTEFFPLSDLENELESALKSGHRVWIVGRLGFQSRSRRAPVLAPAPDPKLGWSSYAYTNVWSEQLGLQIRQHAARVDPVLERQQSVRDWENVPLLVAEGWRY